RQFSQWCSRFGGYEYLLAPLQAVIDALPRRRHICGDIKPRSLEPPREVTSVEAHVIVLTEVQIALRLACNLRILVSLLPGFDDRDHCDDLATRLEDAKQLGDRPTVIDVLENMTGEHGIDAIRRQQRVFDVAIEI